MTTRAPGIARFLPDVLAVDAALHRATGERLDLIAGTPRHRLMGDIIDRLLDERLTLTGT